MNEKLLKIKQWIEVIRDIGLIIGVPALIVIGAGLYERQIDALKAENELLEQFRYDRAWSIIDSQNKIFENERVMLLSQITEAENEGVLRSEEIIQLKDLLDRLNALRKDYEILINIFAKNYYDLENKSNGPNATIND